MQCLILDNHGHRCTLPPHAPSVPHYADGMFHGTFPPGPQPLGSGLPADLSPALFPFPIQGIALHRADSTAYTVHQAVPWAATWFWFRLGAVQYIRGTRGQWATLDPSTGQLKGGLWPTRTMAVARLVAGSYT